MSYDIAFQTQALVLIRQALVAVLADTFDGRVYWQFAPQDAAYPLCVFQSQDGGGRRDDYVGENGWTGQITLRVLSDDPDEADTTLALLPPLLQNQSVEGYSLTVVPDRPLAIPPEMMPEGAVYTAAVICTIIITL